MFCVLGLMFLWYVGLFLRCICSVVVVFIFCCFVCLGGCVFCWLERMRLMLWKEDKSLHFCVLRFLFLFLLGVFCVLLIFLCCLCLFCFCWFHFSVCFVCICCFVCLVVLLSLKIGKSEADAMEGMIRASMLWFVFL